MNETFNLRRRTYLGIDSLAYYVSRLCYIFSGLLTIMEPADRPAYASLLADSMARGGRVLLAVTCTPGRSNDFCATDRDSGERLCEGDVSLDQVGI